MSSYWSKAAGIAVREELEGRINQELLLMGKSSENYPYARYAWELNWQENVAIALSHATSKSSSPAA